MSAVSERDEGQVRISTGAVALEGNLLIPKGARGVVAFAHGSGSSRFSVRNRAVAQSLRDDGIGTLLIDLLTQQEELVDTRTAHLRFDIELLADRLVAATQWLARQPQTDRLKVGLFGASRLSLSPLTLGVSGLDGMSGPRERRECKASSSICRPKAISLSASPTS